MSIILLFLLFLCALVQGDDAKFEQQCFNVLEGKTGDGKSYIVNLNGCPAKSCAFADSCTKNAMSCPNGWMDTAGLDDDGVDHKGGNYEVLYNGEKVFLSGLTYPVYDTLNHFEQKQITCVDFFFIMGANNPRIGSSSQFFFNFTQNDLKCPINYVLNKYRADYSQHQELKDRLIKEGKHVQTVAEDAKKAPLSSAFPSCRFALSPDWKLRVFDSDLAAVRSRVDVKNCDSLFARLQQFNRIMEKQPEIFTPKNCGEKVIVGYSEKDGGFSFGIGPFSFEFGGKSKPIYDTRVNPDCARGDEIGAQILAQANEKLAEEKARLQSMITEIDNGLIECKMKAIGWKPPVLKTDL